MTNCGCSQDKDDKESPAQMLRRVYNKGRFDGLRLAGVDDPGDFMRARKLAEAEASLNATGHKVLEVIPKAEAWPLHRIYGALTSTGCNLGMNAVEGAVRLAVDLGLAKETHPGMFIRVEWKESRVVQMPTRPTEPSSAPERKSDPPPLDPLAALASISANLRALADSIDEQALAFAERLQRVETDGTKLKQLRALLASINE